MAKSIIPTGARLGFSKPDPKTILVIADQPIARSNLRRNLEYYKFEVADSPSAVEGLKLFRDKPTDFGLVILDLTRPELPGTKALQILRSIDPGVKVALCAEETPSEARAGGGDDITEVLKKPIRTDRLLAIVNKLLNP